MNQTALVLAFALLAVSALVGLVFTHTKRDPAIFLTILLGFLLLLSARWVLAPLGGVGTPAIMLGIVALAWWLAAVAVPSLGLARGFQPARWIVLVYAWYLSVGYVIAYTRPLTDLEVSGANRGMIFLASVCGVALLTADGIPTRERLNTLLRHLVWLTGVFALIGIMQFFGFDLVQLIRVPGLSLNREIFSVGDRSIFNRPGSTALHPIEFSVVLSMILPLALHYAIYDDTRRRRQVAWMCAGMTAMAIPMSLSRTGIIALVVAMIFVFAALPRGLRLRGLVLGFAFGCAMYVLIPGLLGTIKSLFLNINSDNSITARIDRTPRVLELWSQNYWFGRGTETYSVEDYFLLDNQYYVTAIENGLVGIAVLVGFLIAGICLATTVRRRGADLVTANLGQAIAASLAVVLVSLATFDALYYKILTTLMFFFVGCAGALWRIEKHQFKPRGVDQFASHSQANSVESSMPTARGSTDV